MRLLDVSPRAVYPPRGGSSLRTFSLLLHLSRRHEVRQFSQAIEASFALRARSTDVRIGPEYRETAFSHPLGRLALAVGPRSWGSRCVLTGLALGVSRPPRLRELAGWADVVMVECPWQVEHCRRLTIGRPLVLAAHRVERQRFRSYADAARIRTWDRAWLRHVERVEARAVRLADLIVAVSAADRLEFVHRYGADPGSVVVVPNGADTDRCAPVDLELKARLRRDLGLGERPVVVYVATSTTANRAGLEWVHRLANATDRFTFLVVGSVSKPAIDGTVHATGHVPDVVPYLQVADLAVCPVQHGAGTKVKLFESLAVGLPTVAFAESLHGIELGDGEHLLVAEKTERNLLAALERLADDSALAGRLGAAGRAFVVERHDWRDAAATLEAALVGLFGPELRRGAARALPSCGRDRGRA